MSGGATTIESAWSGVARQLQHPRVNRTPGLLGGLADGGPTCPPASVHLVSRGAAILGVSGDYHDAAAAVIIDGKVVAAAAEERFTRVKHDPDLPRNAMRWCLDEAGVEPGDLTGVAFYDKPFTTYERILVTSAKVGPKGLHSLVKAIGHWSKSKLWVSYRLERMLKAHGYPMPHLTFAEHHQSHAAAAFYPSPFESAAILTFDGIGEWATSSIAWGSGHRIEVRKELRFPDSLGLLYSAFTSFCGFDVNDGEYKLMGLAPYGEPRYEDVIRDRVVRVADDGSISLDQRWFAYRSGAKMTSRKLADLLDGPARHPDAPLTQREADIARSIQAVLEDIIVKMAFHAHELTGATSACLAGGVALNCVANARILADGPFDDVWIQPAAGDDGSAIGAALWAYHQLDDRPRSVRTPDGMSSALLGPAFGHDEVVAWLESIDLPYAVADDDEVLCDQVGSALAEGAIVGWFQGRMEFGPRALGNRSILADPRDPNMANRLNLAVKRREGFRPFAPAVLESEFEKWFEGDRPLPYMLVTVPVHPDHRVEAEDVRGDDFAGRLAKVRSDIPACTHVDGSARVETVSPDANPLFHQLLQSFHRSTDCPVLINTSFNRRDEPIVRSPGDALRCFLDTDIDILALGRCIVRKSELADWAVAS